MLTIVKVGGGSSLNHAGIVQDLARHQGAVVVVLGANAVRDQIATRLGTAPRVITSASGVSSVYSDDEAIDLLMMAYAGVASARFVSLCQQGGVNAVGLSGVDGALVRGRRNRGIRVIEDGRKRIVRDRSAKPSSINTDLLQSLLDTGYVPVITVPILDEEAIAVNTDNDSIVACLQQALAAERVLHLLEAPGLLRDASDASTLIRTLSPEQLNEMSANAQGRIQRKLMALQSVVATGCQEILVADGRAQHPIRDALEGLGTTIARTADAS